MADKTIVFGATGSFGDLTGWEVQSNSDSTVKARAQTLTKGGEESVAKLHDQKQEVSTTYKADADAPSIPAKIGQYLNGFILTSIVINTTSEDYATMVLTGHNHTENTHGDGVLHTAAHGVSLTLAFGTQDFTDDVQDEDVSSCLSSSVTITCDHTDQNDHDGNHMVGENHTGHIEVKSTYCGDHVIAASGFDITASADSDENTGFTKREATVIKALVMVEPS